MGVMRWHGPTNPKEKLAKYMWLDEKGHLHKRLRLLSLDSVSFFQEEKSNFFVIGPQAYIISKQT